jgi:histidyl-tRNA synthetase
LPAQFSAGEREESPFAIILGDEELKAGLVTVKEQRWKLEDGKKVKIQSEEKGTQVKRDDLIRWLKDTPAFQQWSTGKWI